MEYYLFSASEYLLEAYFHSSEYVAKCRHVAWRKSTASIKPTERLRKYHGIEWVNGARTTETYTSEKNQKHAQKIDFCQGDQAQISSVQIEQFHLHMNRLFGKQKSRMNRRNTVSGWKNSTIEPAATFIASNSGSSNKNVLDEQRACFLLHSES